MIYNPRIWGIIFLSAMLLAVAYIFYSIYHLEKHFNVTEGQIYRVLLLIKMQELYSIIILLVSYSLLK